MDVVGFPFIGLTFDFVVAIGFVDGDLALSITLEFLKSLFILAFFNAMGAERRIEDDLASIVNFC